MSQKSTISRAESFHLYHELEQEEDGVYLQLNGNDLFFQTNPKEVTIRIPTYVWEHIRHLGEYKPQYHNLDDENIRQHAREEVDQRLDAFELGDPRRATAIRHKVDALMKRRSEEQSVLARIEFLNTQHQKAFPPRADPRTQAEVSELLAMTREMVKSVSIMAEKIQDLYTRIAALEQNCFEPEETSTPSGD